MTETAICRATSSIALTDAIKRGDFGTTVPTKSDVENTGEYTEIPLTTLDERDGISGIQMDISFWLSVILMVSNTPSKAEFDSVIGYVRDARAELDKTVDGLEHPPGEAALGYANGMRSGLDTALIALEHLSRLANRAHHSPSADKSEKKHRLHICKDCNLAFFPDTPHNCEVAGNSFTQDDLNRLIGWEAYRVRYPNGTWDDPVNPDEETTDAPTNDAEVYEEDPKPLGMREGSKKHRVWVATEKLLEHGNEMHIDEMLKTVGRLGLFEGVKEPRARFANLLSQYRGMGIIESDNQGNYWLPNGQATD